MGGKIFDSPTPITRDHVGVILNGLMDGLRRPREWRLFGSLSRPGDGPFNDIDIAIKGKDKASLVSHLKSILPSGHVKTTSMVHVLWPHPNGKGLVQVDIVPSENPDHIAWLMKGLFWNMLLAYVARLRSDEESERTGRQVKVTIAHPGGVQKTVDGEVVYGRDSDPASILSVLGLADAGFPSSHYQSFEDLAVSLVSCPELLQQIEKLPFREYVSHLNDHPDHDWSVSFLECIIETARSSISMLCPSASLKAQPSS